MPIIFELSRAAYFAIALVGLSLALVRPLEVKHTLILMGFLISVLFIVFQSVTVSSGMENQWVNVIWPRLQGGLFLAALTTGRRWRVLVFAAPPALSTWLMVLTNGSNPVTEKMVELSVFAAVTILATRQLRTDPLIGWALLVYSIPTIVASPVLILLANIKAWAVWLDVFQVVHAGRILGITLCAVWFWRSTARRPLQMELWPA